MQAEIQLPMYFCGSTHEPGFTIDRPHGNGVYVFAHFQSPVTVRDTTGLRFFPHNGAILYAPGFPQWYNSGEFEMKHSWFHCTGAGMRECVECYGLAINQALELSSFGHVNSFLHDVRRQQLRREPCWELAVSLRAASFFLELGRAMHQQRDVPNAPCRPQAQEALRHLRATVHSDLTHQWSVNEMAGMAHMSASHFTALYTRLFGVSPINDLIHSRTALACALLEQTSHTVAFIAEECGFGSLAYFSRQFRARMGCSPSQYR